MDEAVVDVGTGTKLTGQFVCLAAGAVPST